MYYHALVASDKKRRKKEKKREKKRKSERKHKRKKKKHKSEKEEQHQSYIDNLDETEKAGLRREASSKIANAAAQAQLLQCTDIEMRAAQLGIPKGLIRTSTSSGTSFSDRHSKSLFGVVHDNPAMQRRMKREQTAQRAEKLAREIIEERRRTQTSRPSASLGKATGLSDRFSSGKSSAL
uniref:Uncharacterized protein n=1 Tax=Octactis speculum TaxID=3111310 RepID=A0A7S2CXX4_9STRA